MLRTLVHAVTTGEQVGSQDSECWASEWVLLFWVWATLHCLIDSPLSHSQSQSQHCHSPGTGQAPPHKHRQVDKPHSLSLTNDLAVENFDDLAFRWGVFMRQVVVFRSYMTKQIATFLPANTLNMLNSWSCLAVFFTSLSIITSHPVKNRALLWSKKTFVWSAFTLRFPKIVGLKCFFHREWYFSG